MDVYDIGNKALLCDPSFDIGTLSMFKNPRYNRLRVVPDLDSGSGSEPAPSVRAKSANVRVERVDHQTHRYIDHQEQYEQHQCVTSVLPLSASPTPSTSNSAQMDISPVPSVSTMLSWTPRNSNFNETHSNPVRTEVPVNPPAVAQNVAMTSNSVRNGIPVNPTVVTEDSAVTQNAAVNAVMPPLAPCPSNADRFDLNVHFLLTYLCLKFFSDFKLTSVIMKPFQFLGTFAAVVCSSGPTDAPAGPGTSFGSYGQCDAQYGVGSRYMSAE